MATQLRTYRIRPGAMDQFVELWRTQLAPIRLRLGFTIGGAWIVEDENRFVWLLSHPDGWDAFEAADERYFASPERSRANPDPKTLIEEQTLVRLAKVPPPTEG